MSRFKKHLFGIFAILLSISCTYDNTDDPSFPDISTKPITNITFTTAESGGNVITDNGSTITATGICWSTTPNPTVSDNVISASTDNFVSNLNNLPQNGTYYVRAFATNAAGTGYGSEVSFNTWSLDNTKWAFLLNYSPSNSNYPGDVDFNDDGTAVWDEPSEPGVYTTHGTWTVQDDKVTYYFEGDPLALSYIFTGTVTGGATSMSGTFT
jgi:hypothetical protein